MFKTLFFIFILFQLSNALGKVEMRWLSVAAVVLDDGETQVMFDPMFTRANALHWLNLKKLKSDEEMVKGELEKIQIKKMDAVFSSHSHFDHVIDAPMVAKLTGAIFYVDESSHIIAKAYNDPLIKTAQITEKKVISIGKFSITPILRLHSAIKGLFHYLPGKVPETFDFDFFDYHVGDTWFYYITHPDGTILVDQGSEPFLDKLRPLTSSVDVLIQGVANRRSDEVVLDGYVNNLKPKIFIPTHFDNFIFELDSPFGFELPGTKLEQILTKMRSRFPLINVLKPKYAEKVVILEGREPKLPEF